MKEYVFDVYEDGCLMADHIAVKASSIGEAKVKAEELRYKNEKLVLRSICGKQIKMAARKRELRREKKAARRRRMK